jgi:hypothetical protein
VAFERVGPSGTDFPPSWTPEDEGDRVIGLVTRVDTVTTKNGPRTVIEVDDQKAGPLSVWISAGLKSLGDQVEVGHAVDIVFEGFKVSEKSGRSFKSYEASLDRNPNGS